MALLELQNFSCGYGEMIAVRDLSFAVEPGQILAIMGHVQIKSGSLSGAGNDITRAASCRPAALLHRRCGLT